MRDVVSPVLGALLTIWSIQPSAQSGAPAEAREVKAAYLYQFGRYVDWQPGPAAVESPFVICVLGEDPFGAILDETVRAKTIETRPILIRRALGPGELHDCRVLFVSRSEDDRLPAILKAVEGQRVLTVGEGSQFTRRGGMVAFTREGNRVRFIVNLAAAEAANLRLSSQLLRVAASVDR